MFYYSIQIKKEKVANIQLSPLMFIGKYVYSLCFYFLHFTYHLVNKFMDVNTLIENITYLYNIIERKSLIVLLISSDVVI